MEQQMTQPDPVETNHPFINGYQYTVLLQDLEGETLDQVPVATRTEALQCARRCINKERDKFKIKIQATVIDNFNRAKPLIIK